MRKTMNNMRHTLRLSCVIVSISALVFAKPTSGQSDDLVFCAGTGYPHLVSKLLIEVSAADGVPDDFELEVKVGGRFSTIPVRRPPADADGWWRGQTAIGFWLKEVDPRPKIPGFRVSGGPESCEYRRVKKDVEECAAWFRFKVHQVMVTLKTDPPEASFRLKRDTAAPRILNGCNPAHALQRSPADEKLSAAVQAALKEEKALDSFFIEVAAQDGIVKLSGLVNTPEAKQRAYEIAAKIQGVRRVTNDLQADQPYDGTSMMEVGSRRITIERVNGKDVLFFATVPLPADFVKNNASFPVSRQVLEEAVSRRFSEREDTQHDRNKDLLQKALTGLGNIQSITIERTSEW